MPLGSGYWIKAKTGEEVGAFEHLDAVLKGPAMFGLVPEATHELAPNAFSATPEARRDILTRVIRNGWIRVRMHRKAKIAECWRAKDDVLYSLFEFAQRHNMWDNERITINELGSASGARGFTMTVGQLHKQFTPVESRQHLRKTMIGRVVVERQDPDLHSRFVERMQFLTGKLLTTSIQTYTDPPSIIMEIANSDPDTDTPVMTAEAFQKIVAVEQELLSENEVEGDHE